MQKSRCLLLLVGWLAPGCCEVQALTLDFRLACNLGGTCDAGDFLFDHPEALADLEFLGQFFEPFADSLTPLSATSVTFTHPDTGAAGFSLTNFSVPADTLVIYVGGRDLPGSQVGVGGPGTVNATFSRGQGTVAGSLATDFATWGGVVSFDTKTSTGADRNWHFGPDSSPGLGQLDFFSVALHELAHVLGFGTSDSLENQVTGGMLQGPAATALYGGPVPMEFDPGVGRHTHWADDITSPPYANEPNPSLGSSLRLGKRLLITPLDYAGLADVGWEVPQQLLGLHGNADSDGDVDGLDFLAWQRGYGVATSGNALAGDLSGQGAVDAFDLWLWERYYGATSGAGGFVATPVPEPECVALLALAASLLLAGRRRPPRRVNCASRLFARR